MADLTDPTSATSPALNRRVFVGLGAGAAAFGGSIAAVLAAGDGFGKPHPPIVPENDPAVVVVNETLTHDGRSLGAYAAVPKRPAVGGVVVVQAIWGIDAQLRDVVRRFAKEGYATIAPELYAGLGAPSGDGATDSKPFAEAAAQLADDTVDKDLLAASKWAARPPAIARIAPRTLKIGVTGFCMGGAIALRQAVDNADAFAAAAVWYGKVRYSTSNNNNGPITPIALDYSDEVKVPLLGSFGGRDTSILPDDVRALDKKLTVPHDIKIYDEAGHAFFDDTRPSYVASAAADAWTRTLAWFATYLGRA
jgi:carboxymethylenebutenolidase